MPVSDSSTRMRVSEAITSDSAAGIWATAGIGMLVGMGHYIVPVIATILVFLIIAVLGRFDLGHDAALPAGYTGEPDTNREDAR